MNNKKRFIYNGIMLTAVGIAIRTVALFFNAFVSKAVGAEGVGLYTIVNTVFGFAVTFATSGISLTVTRLVASAIGEGKEERCANILSGAIIYSLAFSLIATAALYFGAGFIAEGILSEGRAARSLRILAPSLIPLSLVSVFSGYFVGIRKVARNAAVQILGQVFKISATVWLLLHARGADTETSAYMLSLGATLTEIACFLLIFIEYLFERRRGGHKLPDKEGVRAVASAAAPLAVSAYIRQALLTIEHVLIPKRLRLHGESGSEALSSYGTLHGMALPLILYPMVTLSSFSGLLVPEFAERMSLGDKVSTERLLRISLEKTLVYALGAAGVIFVFSEELGYVIYNSYHAGSYIAVLAPVIPIMYLDHVTDSVLKGIGEQVYSMWVNISDSLLSIFLVWLLIPKMGIMGYAVCIIAMEAYNFLLSFLRLGKRIRIGISPLRAIVFPLVASLLSSLLTKAAFISAGAETKSVWLVLEILFSAAVFFALINAFNTLTDIIIKRKERVRYNPS
ncbi:MAG: oligosaccharide flippase family protein [Clostridia bacterium]|nr:oligosaccharide flippase family protein [Clostridia bacterium]